MGAVDGGDGCCALAVGFFDGAALEFAGGDDQSVVAVAQAAAQELDVAAVDVAVPVQGLDREVYVDRFGEVDAGVDVEFAGSQPVDDHDVGHADAGEEDDDEALEALVGEGADALEQGFVS